MEHEKLSVFPLDIAALKKGDVIDVPTLERITEKKAGTDEYRYALLALRDSIHKRRKHDGVPVTVAIRRDTLAVLTDQEASAYNYRLFRQRVRQMMSTHIRHMEVDVTLLSDEQKKQHEVELNAGSRVVQAVLTEQKKIALEPTRRTTPGIADAG